VRGKPADTGLHRWRETLTQLESVSLSRRALSEAFSCRCSTGSPRRLPGFRGLRRGRHPSLAGLTVCVRRSPAMGAIPLMPGGLLVVEAILVPGLVSSGMALPDAISAMLIYRLVSGSSSRRLAGWCSSSCSAPRARWTPKSAEELAARSWPTRSRLTATARVTIPTRPCHDDRKSIPDPGAARVCRRSGFIALFAAVGRRNQRGVEHPAVSPRRPGRSSPGRSSDG